jgi:hypothetical protein
MGTNQRAAQLQLFDLVCLKEGAARLAAHFFLVHSAAQELGKLGTQLLLMESHIIG